MTLQIKLILALIGLLSIGGAIAIFAHKEKVEGAQACLQHTEQVGAQQIEATAGVDRDSAHILAQTVATYDQKISDLQSDRDDLARRVHDYEQAQNRGSRPVPAVARSSCTVGPSQDDTAITDRDRREAEDLDTCAANSIELDSMRDAWIELHQRQALEAQKKAAAQGSR